MEDQSLREKEKEIEKRVEKPAEYIVTIMINFLMIWVLYRVQSWLPFLTDSFAAILPLFIISLTASIVANLIFIFYGERFFVSFIKLLLNLWSLVVLVSLYYVFPFDFSAYSGSWDLIARILLIISIVGTAIGVVVEFIQLFSRRSKK